MLMAAACGLYLGLQSTQGSLLMQCRFQSCLLLGWQLYCC